MGQLFLFGRIYLQPLVSVLRDSNAPCARQTPDFLSIISLVLTDICSTFQQSMWLSFVPINIASEEGEIPGVTCLQVISAVLMAYVRMASHINEEYDIKSRTD